MRRSASWLLDSLGWPVLAGLLVALSVPGFLSGQEGEERGYAATEVLGCELEFAVLAAPAGELQTVRRCSEAEGGDLYFAPSPLLDAAHVDSVAVGAADSAGARQVVVRLTEAGARRMWKSASVGGPLEVGVVVDGEVIARFTLRAPEAVDGLPSWSAARASARAAGSALAEGLVAEMLTADRALGRAARRHTGVAVLQ